MKGSDFFMRLFFSVGLIGGVIICVIWLFSGGIATPQFSSAVAVVGVLMVVCLVLAMFFGIWE